MLFIQPVLIGQQLFAKPVLVKSEQEISEYKLDNGMRIVLAPNQKENTVYMNTIYFTGSLNDPQGKGGLAHLLEHLAFKGTKNIAGESYQRQLDQYTLSNNASTEYYSTRYTNYIRPEQNAVDKVLELEAERMDKLVLKEQYVPAEIAIVRREREIRLDQPFSALLDQMWKSAYGNQSLGRLPIGDLEELKSIKAPCLIMGGDRDVIRLEHLVAMFKHIPNSQLCILPGSTHGGAWEQKERFLSIMNDFFLKPFSMPDTKDWMN